MALPDSPGHDGRVLVLSHGLMPPAKPPSRHLTITVDELHKPNLRRNPPQPPQPGVSGTPGGEGLRRIQLYDVHALPAHHLHAAVGRPGIHVNDRQALATDRLQAPAKALAFVPADDHEPDTVSLLSVRLLPNRH